MARHRIAILFAAASTLVLTACGRDNVNPPTEPARAIDGPQTDAPPPAPPPGVGSVMPGAGPQTFVGRWAHDVSWCLNEAGPEQPIEITPTRFDGYENSCLITRIDQVENGYIAGLACLAEGMTKSERVRLTASGQTLTINWLDRGGPATSLTKCTTLKDTSSTTAPSLESVTR